MKVKSKGVKLCVCGKAPETTKSFFTKLDIISGVVIAFVVLPVWLFLTNSLYVLSLPIALLLGAWILCFVIGLLRGHSPKCAARWGLVVPFGLLGGFWYLGL